MVFMSTAILSPAVPQLVTGDIELTASFFETKLGFEIVSKFPERNHLIVRRGLAEIQFWQAPSDESAREIAMQSSCYIRVENVENLFQEYRASDVPFGYELTHQPWGMHEMQVNDSSSNGCSWPSLCENYLQFRFEKKTRTRVKLLERHPSRTSFQEPLVCVLFSAREFSHGLGRKLPLAVHNHEFSCIAQLKV